MSIVSVRECFAACFFLFVSFYNNINNNASIFMVENKLPSVGSSNKYMFNFPAKVCKETDAERMLAGKLFHTRGPATVKYSLVHCEPI